MTAAQVARARAATAVRLLAAGRSVELVEWLYPELRPGYVAALALEVRRIVDDCASMLLDRGAP